MRTSELLIYEFDHPPRYEQLDSGLRMLLWMESILLSRRNGLNSIVVTASAMAVAPSECNLMTIERSRDY